MIGTEPPAGFPALSAGTLFAGFFVSSVGLGLFLYGKKQMRLPQLVAGSLLMLLPFVVTHALTMLALGAVVVGAVWLACR